jgi:succinate dehydrogenase/fumarate reductase-like Fe-S protein
MKKLICILLVSWLPVFMATANAMSLQMALQVNVDIQEQVSMPCHDKASKKSDSSSDCVGCGFCMIATSIANVDMVPFLDVPAFTSLKVSFINVEYKSTDYSPAFRPPILN